MIKRWTKVAGLMAVSLAVIWLSCPFEGSRSEPENGHLLSMTDDTNLSVSSSRSDNELPAEKPSGLPFRYEKEVKDTPAGPVVMHFLEISLESGEAGVKPVIPNSTLFGYEYLSVMAEKTGALAAVNGGFSQPNGLPGGMLYSNKTLKTAASGRSPVLFLFDDRAVIADASQKIWLESEDATTGAVFYNTYSAYDGIYVFTPDYGSNDRIEKQHVSATVVDGKVSVIKSADGPVQIPSDGFLISAVGNEAEKRLRDFAAPGREVRIKNLLETSPDVPEGYVSAYECGSWLVRDGVNVCPEYDAWVGNLLVRAPRTAVGIKWDGTLIFTVVDGRNSDVSIGVSGPELADILIEKGVIQAAMLDGGASSEMIVEGKIVNSPSAGRERLISSCFVVFSKKVGPQD